uniref:Secreted protein n=2 Tax=Gossypium raimondii TaxID=29730 RepID=A0A0D2PF45_GOSRA|nr:hypothetical protein B456_007G262300 [Gossypium raimondii]
MTLPTSSLFPLTTLLPLLAFAPLFSRKSAVKMVSTDGFTARLLLHIQRESWSTRLIFLIRKRYKINWHGKQMKGQARIYLKLG